MAIPEKKIKNKLAKVLEKNVGFHTISKINKILNGDNATVLNNPELNSQEI